MIVCQKPANIGRSIYYARCAHPVDARNVREYRCCRYSTTEYPRKTFQFHRCIIVFEFVSIEAKTEKLLRKLRFEIPPFRISYPSEKNDRRRRNREIGRSLERGTIVSHRWSHRLDDEAMRRISEIPGTWKTPPASVFFPPVVTRKYGVICRKSLPR